MSSARPPEPGVIVRVAALAFVGLFSSAWPLAAEPPESDLDGLARVRSERFDAAYLAPGADFSPYTKVMLDPTEAAFTRNWQRDYNSSTRGTDRRISDDEAREMLQAMQTAFHQTLTEAYQSGGYEVVTIPGPDVLRVRTSLTNIHVNAPDQLSAGRTFTFSEQAGEARLTLEVRDSMSGAVLGRATDRRSIGDRNYVVHRDRISNRSDFMRAFRQWAQKSVEALNALRATPAAPTAGG